MPMVQCPKCREPSAECTRTEKERADTREVYDCYTLSCPCGHSQVLDVSRGSEESGWYEMFTTCPFCNGAATDHRAPVPSTA